MIYQHQELTRKIIAAAIEVHKILGPGLLKSVESVLPVHEAQLLTYLRLTGRQVGLLINFNETMLKNGIHRKVLNAHDSDVESALTSLCLSGSKNFISAEE